MRTAKDVMEELAKPSEALLTFQNYVKEALEDSGRVRRGFNKATHTLTLAIGCELGNSDDCAEFRRHMAVFGWEVVSIEYIQREGETHVVLKAA